MTPEHLIDSYGYLAVLIGTFVEGETVLVFGGIAAKLGYLKLPWVIACAFSGGLISDQFFFFVGRFRGQTFLDKRPAWQRRAAKVQHILERHRFPIILGFRFLYGLRIATPLVIGMSRIPVIEFVLLNIIGTALWATAIGTLGYAFGHGLELILGDIRRYEIKILMFILVTGTLLWLIVLLRNRRRQKQIPPHDRVR